MVLKRVGVLSCGKISGVIYAAFGLLAGLLLTVISFLGAAIGTMANESQGAVIMLFGVGAVIILPIMYGMLGFIGGLVAAALYNLVAGFLGGLEVELE